ncbi:MAG TPA: hypothetical protein DCZ01_06500 [Elusimicrobia bacterium]|nr:MAG: hypothetical protein A2X37_02550 [Elusimicrobia bacterium GWA2_66_18]HAZ08160.1 hypothetical protein [Elusimicrobiota bacterium]
MSADGGGFEAAERFALEGEFEKAFELLAPRERDARDGCLYVSVCRMLKKDAQAKRELEKILAADPSHARANHLQAMELLDAGRLGDAEACLRRAEAGYQPEQTGELSELHLDWGNLHFERKDTIQAVLSWRRALGLAPANEAARKNLEQFEDPRFEETATVNEMILLASHPSQVLAHLMRAREFKSPGEAQEFADYVLSLWNNTPRGEPGDKSP